MNQRMTSFRGDSAVQLRCCNGPQMIVRLHPLARGSDTQLVTPGAACCASKCQGKLRDQERLCSRSHCEVRVQRMPILADCLTESAGGWALGS